MSYVTTSGSQFMLDGNRFRYIGLNYYQLMQENYTIAQLQNFFDYCQRSGIRVVRCFMQNKIGPATATNGYFLYMTNGQVLNNEVAYVNADRVLSVARDYGVKIVFSLFDNFPEFNDWACKQEMCYWSNTIYSTAFDRYDKGDDFYLDPNIIQWQKDKIDFMSSRVNTFNGRTWSQDDTIMAIECGNEMRMTTGTDTNSGALTSYRLGVLTDWYDEISTYIKLKFPNHLVGTGSQAQFYDYVENDPKHNGTFYGGNFTTQHALDNIDFFDFHIYAYEDYDDPDNLIPPLRAYGIKGGYPNAPTKNGFLYQLHEYSSIAKTATKPVVLHEYGLDKRVTTIPNYIAYPRWEHYKLLIPELFRAYNDFDGLLIWSGGTLDDNINYAVKLDGVHTSSNDPQNLNTNDSKLVSVISQWSDKLSPSKRIKVDSVNGIAI